MTWDISAGRIRAGLTAGDTSADTQIQVAMDQALSLAERYCDRFFMFQTQVEDISMEEGYTISLRRYPLDEFVSVTVDPSLSGGWFDPLATAVPIAGGSIDEKLLAHLKTLGITAQAIAYDAGLIRMNLINYSMAFRITYQGGYKILPPDLELALWMIFDVTYGAIKGGSVSAGGMKRVALTGVGSVDFDTGNGASTGGAWGGLIPDSAAFILCTYTREKC